MFPVRIVNQNGFPVTLSPEQITQFINSLNIPSSDDGSPGSPLALNENGQVIAFVDGEWIVVQVGGGGGSQSAQVILFDAIGAKTFGEADFSPGAIASSGLPIIYSSSNTNVATVVAGNIRIVGAGTATITANQIGNANFLPANPVSQTLTVAKANQTITFPAITAREVGDSPYNTNAVASSGLPVTLVSSNPLVATISGTTINVVEDGATVITATQPGNANYNAAPSVIRNLTVTVSEKTLADQTGIALDADVVLFNSLASPYNETQSKPILDRLIKRLKINNLWGDIERLYVPYGSSFSGKRLNIKDPYNAGHYLTIPSGVDAANDTSYYTNGSKVINTNLNCASLDGSNFCVFAHQNLVYNTDTGDFGANGFIIGATNNTHSLALQIAPRNFRALVGNQTVNLVDTDSDVGATFTDALHTLSVRAGKLYYEVAGNRKVVDYTHTSFPSIPLALGGINTNGSLSNPNNMEINILGITKNISAGKLGILNSIVDKYLKEAGLIQDNGVIIYGDSIGQGYWAYNNGVQLGAEKWASRVSVAKGWSYERVFGITGVHLVKIGEEQNNAVDKVFAPNSYNPFTGIRPFHKKFNKIFVSYGVNDAKGYNNVEYNISLFNTVLRNVLDQLILRLRWPADRIVLLSTTYLDYTMAGRPATTPDRQTAINNYIQQAATDYGLTYIDVRSPALGVSDPNASWLAYTAPEYNGAISYDGVHPNNSYHQLIANTILANI